MRFESPTGNARGFHVGVFGLANGLTHAGRLNPDDWAWWRSNNDWFNAAYPDPATVDDNLFTGPQGKTLTCWFKMSAHRLLERIPGYLDLLDRYDVPWRERQTRDPGVIKYEDDVQVVVQAAAFGS